MLPVVHHPDYDAPLPEGHRFPMPKFRRLAEVLVENGIVALGGFHVPAPLSAEALSLAHDAGYVEAVLTQTVSHPISREIGLPISETVARRAQAACGGTLETARLALLRGIACNTAGGSHHARRAQGAGFCVFNDVGTAIALLRKANGPERIAVIDLDVHQGDGTADILRHDRLSFTLSVHAEKNYPVRKIASDLDVALPDGMEDAAYLEVVRDTVAHVLNGFRPDLVFYNAGVDPHRDDRLGRLKLSDAGLMERERTVIGLCRERDVPIAGVLGGGYAPDIDTLAQRHATLHRAAAEFL